MGGWITLVRMKWLAVFTMISGVIISGTSFSHSFTQSDNLLTIATSQEQKSSRSAQKKPSSRVHAGLGPECPLGEAVQTDGHRRLALVVGVGKYASPAVRPLPGAVNDAKSMVQLLTGPGGFGYPLTNVCLLLNEQATTANFIRAFEDALIKRALPQDSVVVYFAGHGSYTMDLNGDEPDELDETLLFYDARTGAIHDMPDDVMNEQLSGLYKKTNNIAVILDSCSSGSATRGDFDGERFEPAELLDGASKRTSASLHGDGGAEWLPKSMPDIVVMSAAADRTVAREMQGAGVFTNALIRAIRDSGSTPTYAQLSRLVPPLVAAASAQIPSFQGNLDRVAFSNEKRERPIAWEVTAIDRGTFVLEGPPLPGWTKGARIRLYPGTATLAQTGDPIQSKASLLISDTNGVRATATRDPRVTPSAVPPRVGDLAILAYPGAENTRLRVKLNLPDARANAIRRTVEQDPSLSSLIDFVFFGPNFVIKSNQEGQLQLVGPEGRVRNTFAADLSTEPSKVARALWGHARQKGLMNFQADAGTDFKNNQTLEVTLLPERDQLPCSGTWVQAPPNTEQIIPLCYNWRVHVKLSVSSPVALLVGGLLLTNDGTTIGFPAGEQEKLLPGQELTFNTGFTSVPPLEAREHLLVFGTRETEPVQWSLYTDPGKLGRNDDNALTSQLEAFLGNQRGANVRQEAPPSHTWTSSYLPIKVEANARFGEIPAHADEQTRSRGDVLPMFDIRPYLPDNTSAALYMLLRTAHWLTAEAQEKGLPYKIHDWKGRSDEVNLERGIDCSRAIWFAFTRAGLKYNRDNTYLSSKQMVGMASPMTEEFDSCMEDPKLRLGDILVYRDEARQAGHVVMVIDPEKHIAWGAHGFDDKAQKAALSPVGVQYQKLKYRTEWERWDWKDLKRSACWRYKQFDKEQHLLGGELGTAALSEPCSRERCKPPKKP